MLKINTKYQNKLKGLTFVDLFAGIGGFRIAMESYGAKCVFSSEIDTHAKATYSLNYNEVPYGDITKINEKDIPDFDILCAGFPCQAFSISGKQKGFSDARGTLFFDVLRIAEAKKPKILFLENVKNYSRHDFGRTMEYTINSIKDLGYDFYYDVLNAKDFSLPQKRERTIMVAFRKDLSINSFTFPKPLEDKLVIKDILLKTPNPKYIIDEKALVNLKVDLSKQDKISYNSPVRLGTIKKGGQGDRIYSSNAIGITISATSGGTGSKTGLYYYNSKVRKLSPREAARIQGFPESFKLYSKDAQMLKMFGNSVPINLLQAVIKEIINTIGDANELERT